MSTDAAARLFADADAALPLSDADGPDVTHAPPDVTDTPADKPDPSAEPDPLAEIAAAEATCAEAEFAMLDAKEAAKAATEAYKLTVAQLRKVVRQQTKGHGPLPLFDGPAESKAPAPSGEDDSWRDHFLGNLDLSPGLVAALADAGLATVGDLSDWTAAGNALTDLEGIGEAKATAIDDALTAFWGSRSIATAPAPTLPLTDADGADSPDGVDSTRRRKTREKAPGLT